MSADYSDIEILDSIESSEEGYSYDITTATGTYLELISSNMVWQLSTEYMRKSIGGFFFITEDTSLDKFIFGANLLETDSEDDERGIDMQYLDPLSTKIHKLEVNAARITPIDTSVMLPNYKIPFRMYANSEETRGDVYWREYFTGGSYGTTDFKNLIDVDNVYYDIAINLKTPIGYEILRAYDYLSTSPDTDYSIFEAKCNYKDYNQYVQNYQDWSSELTSELLMPNYNIILTYFYDLFKTESLTEEELATWASERRIGYTKARDDIMNYTFLPGIDMFTLDRDVYFGSYFTRYPFTEEVKENVIRYQQNIMFDSLYYQWLVPEGSGEDGSYGDVAEAMTIDSGLSTAEGLEVSDSIEKYASNFFDVKLKFTRHIYQNFNDTTLGVYEDSALSGIGKKPRYHNLISDSIEQPSIRIGKSFLTHKPGTDEDELAPENLSSKTLEILKDMDEGNITEIPIRRQSFAYSNNFKSVEYNDSGLPKNIKNNADLPTDTIGLKSFSYIDFLTYMYNNYDAAINDNYIFMGETMPEHVTTLAEDTLYRNKISQDILNSIKNSLHHMSRYFYKMEPDIWTDSTTIPEGSDDETITGLLETSSKEVQEDIFKKILSPTKKFYEVLAYKVEKVKGTSTGDGVTQNVIQKFWFYNDRRAPKHLELRDSQVKYGQSYTYKISAYALVLSHKYKYSDYRLTKQIGSGQKFDTEDETETPKFCLQFYDPLTNQVASQMFTTTTADAESLLKSFIESAISLDNEFANDQVDVSFYPHLADFNLYLEPCLEVVEIPFAQKTVKIMDSPPNAINVIPFHFIDNSDRIGFKIGQDSYINRPWPEIIKLEDILMKTDYLNSREIMDYQNITEPSQSPARFIEMYRINKKPNSFTDFRNSLVSTMDLKGGSSNRNHNYLDYVAADQIIPNKKYYYLFRLLNENKVPGPVSQIIEAELVNDGGYIYSLFDVVDSSEFNPNKIQTKIKDCKKIMQLEPHIDQMMFDVSGIDFDNPASDEVANLIVGVADELMWDSKRFKIRLTSKKTGRKLDLNTGFNLRIKDETTADEDPIPEGTPGTGLPPIWDEIPTGDPDGDPEPVTDPPETGPPAPPTTADDVPTLYGSQPDFDGDGMADEDGYTLWASQVHFIVYGGEPSGYVGVFDWIHNWMTSTTYGSAATSTTDVRATTMWNALGSWLYSNREVTARSMDNWTFVAHLADMLAMNEDASWVGDFYTDYETILAYTPEILNYYDPSLMGTLALSFVIQSEIASGFRSAGSTAF